MARCWRCGSQFPGGVDHVFSCPKCAEVQETIAFHKDSIRSFDELADIQQQGFNMLSDSLEEVSSIIEWGFHEVSWRLQQQTDALRSIDHTLKTPSQTRANELRIMAEELRTRQDLLTAEETFSRALDSNPLDYRIYVGYALTCLDMREPDKARTLLEKSLLHAPKEKDQGIDPRSSSYRLIGRTYFCEENYPMAKEALSRSIQLSPAYYSGHYDHAQYAALVGNSGDCLVSLRNAVVHEPFYYDLARKENNFRTLAKETNSLLDQIAAEAKIKAEQAIEEAENMLRDAKQSLTEIEALHGQLAYKWQSNDPIFVEQAERGLRTARDTIKTLDYPGYLGAALVAEKCKEGAKGFIATAHDEENRVGWLQVNKESEHNHLNRALMWQIIALAAFFIGFILMAGGGAAKDTFMTVFGLLLVLISPISVGLSFRSWDWSNSQPDGKIGAWPAGVIFPIIGLVSIFYILKYPHERSGIDKRYREDNKPASLA